MRTTLRSLALAAALTVATSACATAPPSVEPVPATNAAADTGLPVAVVDGDRLLLVDGDDEPAIVATVTDGDLLHAEVRPATDGPVTVLALVRTDAPAYELRYLHVDDEGTPTDLYGFPWRLQVDPASVAHADVPTTPVWAPEGDAIAWLEVDDRGVRLRTQGWLAYETSTNPAEAGSETAVPDLPVGSQLTAWELAADGTDVLVATTPDDEIVRIRLDETAGTA